MNFQKQNNICQCYNINGESVVRLTFLIQQTLCGNMPLANPTFLELQFMCHTTHQNTYDECGVPNSTMTLVIYLSIWRNLDICNLESHKITLHIQYFSTVHYAVHVFRLYSSHADKPHIWWHKITVKILNCDTTTLSTLVKMAEYRNRKNTCISAKYHTLCSIQMQTQSKVQHVNYTELNNTNVSHRELRGKNQQLNSRVMWGQYCNKCETTFSPC
jgi:hypothetical protein